MNTIDDRELYAHLEEIKQSIQELKEILTIDENEEETNIKRKPPTE